MFNNIAVISWRSVLLVEETRVFIAKKSTQEVHRSTDYGPEVHRFTDYGPSHAHFVVSRGLYDEELYQHDFK